MAPDLSQHFKFMAVALFVGYKALLKNETPVACVVTRGCQIISIGYNHTNITLNGTKHAEFIALGRLKEPVDYKNLTLYVTVEPCIMCASYLRQLGLKNVIYGCGNDRFGGAGTILPLHNDPKLPHKPLTCIDGICRTEAIQLLRNFYIQENESAPTPKLKKNKDIDDKVFPPNINPHLDEYPEFYGEARIKRKGTELTPIVGKGYNVSEFLNLDELKKVPHLEEELGSVANDQVADFKALFYDIDESGHVLYEQHVEKYDSKRRKLSLDSH